MKILLVHNYYRAETPSGENTVFDAEGALLEAAGHQVERFTRSNDEFRAAPLTTALAASLLAAHNPSSVAAFRRRSAAFRPDIVHVHNTFPLITPAILSAARDSGAAVVATLHNYRLVCAQGGYLRQGRICTECLDRRSSWPAIAHGCYRGRIASVPVASTIAWHRHAQTWNRSAHALIVLTGFQKTMMTKAGLAENRLHVKGNFTPDAEPIPWSERDPTVVFLGRVSEEKGIRTLIDAWQILGVRAPQLRIIGAGDGLASLRARVASSGLAGRIDVVGALPHADAMLVLARARLLVFPSIWYEPFGMSIIEAYARGVAVAASRIGSLPDLVHEARTGTLFAPGDAQVLADRVVTLWNDQGELERMGLEARREWARNHAAEENLGRLESIYQEARSVQAAQGHPP